MPRTTEHTRATILAALERPKVLERALVVLYARQTASEQAGESTNEHNGRGFSKFDAPFLSSLATQVLENKYGQPEGRRLTARQREVALPKVRRYARQLLEEARIKEQAMRASGQSGPVGVPVQDGTACPDCGGQGWIEQMNATQDAVDDVPCPRCGAVTQEV